MELFEFSIRYLLLPLFSNLENFESFILKPVFGIGFDILMYVLGEVEFSTFYSS